MLRVGFLSISFRLDKSAISNLRKEMIKLAERDEHLEFWFFGCHDELESKAIQFILELRDALSRNQIDIVAVSDPVKNERLEITEFDETKDGFLEGSVTRVEVSPRFEGKLEQHPNRFVEHYRKVERWLIEQCDIVLAFHYDSIPHSVNTEIRRLKKRGKHEVISVFNQEFSERIDAFIAEMEGRDAHILQSLRAGISYKALSEELGITVNRVQQIANRAVRTVMRHIRCEK